MPGVDLHHYFVAMRDFVVNWWPLLGLTFYILLLYIFWRMLQLMPKVKPAEVDTKSRSAVTWSDVAGVDEVRAELQEVVDFLRNPRQFERLGARVPRRQCGGYVVEKSGCSEISGSVSSWSSAEATWTTPAARAASTSCCIADTVSSAPGTYSFPCGSMKSTCVSTSQRILTRRARAADSACSCGRPSRTDARR